MPTNKHNIVLLQTKSSFCTVLVRARDLTSAAVLALYAGCGARGWQWWLLRSSSQGPIGCGALGSELTVARRPCHCGIVWFCHESECGVDFCVLGWSEGDFCENGGVRIVGALPELCLMKFANWIHFFCEVEGNVLWFGWWRKRCFWCSWCSVILEIFVVVNESRLKELQKLKTRKFNLSAFLLQRIITASWNRKY